MNAIKQQYFVAAIDEGMNRFAQHGRATCPERCDSLSDGYEKVADKSGIYHHLR
jgi:hypothetical protein